jgi:hypothetical protein
MSGYLQRLASRALNARASIHPILGSVFSPSTYAEINRAESPVTPQPEESAPRPELAVAAPAARILRDAAPEPGAPEPRQSISNTPPFQEIEAAPPLHAPERASFKPLVENTQLKEVEAPAFSIGVTHEAGGLHKHPSILSTNKSDVATPESGRSVSGVSLSTVTSASGERTDSSTTLAVTPQHLSQQGNTEKAESVLKGAYKPLMQEKLRLQAPPGILRDASSPITRDNRREDRRDLSRRLTPPEREPDEIQIHIGRIEVIAAPPSPARAEAKRVPKSLSLDDYLKRRNGGAG